MKPTIGRIVHFDGPRQDPTPGIITAVSDDDAVSAQLFLNHHAGMVYMCAVPHESDAGPQDLFWRWPPRVE